MSKFTWELTTAVFNMLETNSFQFTLSDESFKFPNEKSKFLGAYIKLDESFKNMWLMNTTRIEFESIYPSVLNNILNTYNVKFNFIKFNKIYTQFLSLSNNKIEKDITFIFIKKWINLCFGILQNNNYYLKSNIDLPTLIHLKTNQLFEKIHNEFSSHVIYIDTEFVIFQHFHEISSQLFKILQDDEYNYLSYEINNVDFMIWRKKQYILKDYIGNLCIKGFKRKQVS
jgi:hypothetical protein